MIRKRLSALRALMKKEGIQAYVIPSTDPHQSEYLPAVWQRRSWISGFDGSAGEVVVTANDAGLWTDSRYFIQAEEQLRNTGITLYKIGVAGQPVFQEFLVQHLQPGDKIGIDPRVILKTSADKMQGFFGKHHIEVVYLESNLIDQIWEAQPAFPKGPVMLWPEKYAGESVETKLQHIRKQMEKEGADALVLSALDQIAWTFNIRGTDVDYNPVVISYALILSDEARIFLDQTKISHSDRASLSSQIKLFDYDAFAVHLARLKDSGSKIWIDAATASKWIANRVGRPDQQVVKQSPVTLLKSRKNDTELQGFRNCHIRDGVAMVKFLHWLEERVPAGGVTEISAAKRLYEFRSEQDLFQGESFSPISGYAAHGAIVHYSATEASDAELKSEGIYLIDSGGQYLDGTTDITRTIALGTPTAEQKDRFTRVLKGHLNLAMARFPEGTTGIQLDTIARKPLWDIGENYGHGTGHGIGAFLNVHEGPQAISYYRGIGVALEAGMICSNEPGFYKEGEYGIRIENLIEVQVDQTMENNRFYTFATASLCPIDSNLIDKSLLDGKEIAFYNDYHERVREELMPLLDGPEQEWLTNATRAI